MDCHRRTDKVIRESKASSCHAATGKPCLPLAMSTEPRESRAVARAGGNRDVFGAVEPLVILYPATEETEGPIR